MSDKVIRVENLSKEYRLGTIGGGTVREDLARWWANRLGKADPTKKIDETVHRNRNEEHIFALRDVSFEVKQGEVLGIIGRNGAGKSTLLKILSRITSPTSGEVKVRGRIASLLEVGTGFHPELTGSENVYLNGAILGMRKYEIDHKFDEIVAFSGVEEFINTPVKRYSSGMKVRLAFAVAAHLEPEILLVDEVLAVGDHKFQKKSMAKMNEVASEGRTVLFVSHNLQAISTLTQNCLLLSEGRSVFYGSTQDSIRRYLNLGISASDEYNAFPSPTSPCVINVKLNTSEPNSIQLHGQPMEVNITISAPYALENAAVSFQVINSLQQPVLYLWRFDSEFPMCREPGTFQLECCIPKTRLYMGHYTLTVHFSECYGKKSVIKIENICPFEVVMHGKHHDFKWNPDVCTFIEDAEWKIHSKISKV